ncbi:MAG: hypothetical protein AB7N69_12550 [Immundisolibacter sp.]|uniref:hypothetical protein n=1 Tax=Immundisolibacter sp. TaxID=1934948 RepID=UPI003D0E2198
MSTTLLPAAYRHLEPWAQRWALATQNEREAARRASSGIDLKVFYDALIGEVDGIIGHLNTLDLESLPPPEQRLLYLTLSLAEVAPHIELYRGDPRVPYSFEEERFIAEHGGAAHYLGDLYAIPNRPA